MFSLGSVKIIMDTRESSATVIGEKPVFAFHVRSSERLERPIPFLFFYTRNKYLLCTVEEKLQWQAQESNF